jgi:RNA polymerase sigma-70 factor (ECF subfamily)
LHTSLDADQERQLLQAALHNPDAFRALYRHYFPRLYAYVAYRVGHAGEAEDLTADIFVKVVERLGTFEYRGVGSFAAWLFRIAHNHVSQFYRDRAEYLSLDDVPDIAADDLAPDQAIARKERFIHLRTQLTALSPRRREIITLKFFGGLRNQEIAAILGLDERTVASHLCRGIDDLGRKLEAEPDWKYDHE